MHDPKSFNNEDVQRFEKEVQQKMEGLEFSPSEAVWANVAQAVNGGKKRRRVPLFWFFFLPAFLLVGAAGVYFIGGHSPLTATVSKGINSRPGNNFPSGTDQQSGNSQQNKSTQQTGPGLNQHPGNNQLTGNNQQPKNDQRANDQQSNAIQPNDQQPNGQQPDKQLNSQLATNTRSATNGRQPDNKLSDNKPPDAQLATNGRHLDHKQPNAQSVTNDPSAASSQPATTTRPVPDETAAIRSGAFHHPATGKPEDNNTADNNTAITTGTRSKAKGRSAPGGKTRQPGETTHQSGETTHQKNTTPAIAGTENVQPPAEDGSVEPERTSPAGTNTESGSAATGDQEPIGKVSGIHLSPASDKNAPKITAAPPVSKSLAFSKTRLRPKRSWEAGFAGGVGVSSLNQALLKRSVVVAANDNRNSMAAITGQPQVSVSKIQPDLSFWAGIFMQKPLLNDLSVSVGLNLHYYSTRIITGDKVDVSGALASLPTNLYTGQALSSFAVAAAPSPSYPYYAAGDKHTFINRYYFLEIPASIQWQVTHSRVLPLFWEAGVSLSYLMSSNALYYNTKAGVYYKDGNVSNKTQFNLSTALMVGLPVKGIDLRAGPQVQYGITSLLNTDNTGQHLFYGGLKFVIIPEKTHKANRYRFGDQ